MYHILEVYICPTKINNEGIIEDYGICQSNCPKECEPMEWKCHDQCIAQSKPCQDLCIPGSFL